MAEILELLMTEAGLALVFSLALYGGCFAVALVVASRLETLPTHSLDRRPRRRRPARSGSGAALTQG